jgi:fructose-bisphosphate aldolase, class II
MTQISEADFNKALSIGRPPNIRQLFPNSRALLVSGKYIDLAMLTKKQPICIACNGRNSFVIRGTLKAAQRANSVLIIEIAKSEGGANAYCDTNFWNMARTVDTFCNEMQITIPVAIHADHYGIKNAADIEAAKIEIPSMFDAGITSIAIDASHLPDDQNLLANLELNPFVPEWSGLETEVVEIKGKLGLSTREEALFLIQGLNAHGIFPNWIALNNGTTHGIEASDQGIQVELTADIHQALTPYNVSGAQHATSGNSSDRLRQIARQTRTTKANVATALQMISWGLEVNDYGNAILDDKGEFIKVQGQGVTDEMWTQITTYAETQKKFGAMIELPRTPLTADQITAPNEFFSYGTNDLNKTTCATPKDDTEANVFLIVTPEAKIFDVEGEINQDEISPSFHSPQLSGRQAIYSQLSYFYEKITDETGNLRILLIFHLLIIGSVVGCYLYLAASGAEIPEELREALKNIIAYCIGIASGIAISPQRPRS